MHLVTSMSASDPEASVATSFDRVDELRDPQAVIDYLDAQSANEFWRQLKLDSIRALTLGPGNHALDIGCGLGDEVRAMARLVGPCGKAVGVDCSEALIRAARSRTAPGTPVEFRVADAHRLPFDDALFDAVRIERTLQHTKCPSDVLREVFRVITPGAKAIAIEPDWDTLIIAAEPLAVSRAICRRWASRIRNPAIGRQLPALFRQMGFREVRIEPRASVILDVQYATQQFAISELLEAALAQRELDGTAAQQWWDELHARGDGSGLVASVTYFVVSGRKPPARCALVRSSQ